MEDNDTNTAPKHPAPAGSLPASGSGDRSRSEGQTPTDLHHSSAIPEAKGWVELRKASDTARQRAATWCSDHELGRALKCASPKEVCSIVAAEIEAVVGIFETLCAEPGPQSERIEGAVEAALRHVIEAESSFAAFAAKCARSDKDGGHFADAETAETEAESAADRVRLLKTLLPEQAGEERAGLRNGAAVPPAGGTSD